MEDELPKIDVRKLISVYESGAVQRPRARSLGDVLQDDVVVRSHSYRTLSDIQNTLEVVEVNLGYYQNYQKAQHVKFQETLFTLLTSVINIEADADDDPVRKKSLIAKTQKLVSVLNQKLPNSSVTEITSNSTENEFGVSVRKMGKYFQRSTSPKQNDMGNQKSNNSLIQKTSESESDKLSSSPEISTESNEESMSVRKLRDIFEQKQKENQKGLEIIIKPKIFQYEVNIPYTAESLGRYRLLRANSGNYMNEVGILNRVSLFRAKSSQDIKANTNTLNSEYSEEQQMSLEDSLKSHAKSDASSEISESSNSIESVKEVNVDTPAIWNGGSSFSVKNTVKVFETFRQLHIQNDISEISEHTTTNLGSLDENQTNLGEDDFSLESAETLNSQISMESMESEIGSYTSADRNDLMF